MQLSGRLCLSLWLISSLFSLSPIVDAASGPSALRPNILLIMSDDHAQRAISAYGDNLVTGKQPANWRTALYYHYYQYPGWHMVNPHYGIRTATHKLIHFYTMDHWELYDLGQDPQELHNRYNSPAYAQLKTQLHAQLRQLRTRYGDSTGATEGG